MVMKRGVFEREKDVPRDVSVKCPNPQQWGRHGGVKISFQRGCDAHPVFLLGDVCKVSR